MGWVPTSSLGGEPIFSIGIGGTQSISVDFWHPREAALYLPHCFSPEGQAHWQPNVHGMAPVRGGDPAGTALLAALHEAFERGSHGVRSIFYVPCALPAVVSAFTWSMLYSLHRSQARACRPHGIHGLDHPWRGDFRTALTAWGGLYAPNGSVRDGRPIADRSWSVQPLSGTVCIAVVPGIIRVPCSTLGQ